MTASDPKGQDLVVTPTGTGRDQVRTGAGPPGGATVGHVFRGWKHSMRDNLIIVLLIAILIGTLAGNHYSAKAATQKSNGQELAQLKAIVAEIQDVTLPGGKVFEANKKAGAASIAAVNAAGNQRMICVINHIDVLLAHVQPLAGCPPT